MLETILGFAIVFPLVAGAAVLYGTKRPQKNKETIAWLKEYARH